MGVASRPTVRVTNIPQTVTAQELLTFLESKLGSDSVFVVEISSDHKNRKSRGFDRVQFTTLKAKLEAQSLSLKNDLVFKSESLCLSETYDDVIQRPVDPKRWVKDTIFHVGFMVKEDCMNVLETWNGVRGWVMLERKRVEFWVWRKDECYKLEIAFENFMDSVWCCLGGEKVNASMLMLCRLLEAKEKLSSEFHDALNKGPMAFVDHPHEKVVDVFAVK